MNLISCNSCGVVLDAGVLNFAGVVTQTEAGHTDDAVWDGDDYVPSVPCTVCKEKVTE